MQKASKKYLNGFINADDEINLLKDNEIIFSQNLRFSTTDEGTTSKWESVLSNSEIVNTYLPATGINTNIGIPSTEDGRYIVLFNHNSLGDHGIYAYRKSDNTFYKVLLNAQVTGGLNFSKNNLITSRIVNGIVYFTDNVNEPRRINIESGIKLNHSGFTTTQQPYTSPVSSEVITLIRRPPNYPLSVTKINGSTVGLTLNTNQIKDGSFRFTYFFTDWNGEETTLALHSLLAPYNFSSETEDTIKVQIPFSQNIGQYVRKITLAVVYADSEKAFEIKTWDKTNTTDLTSINAHNSQTTALTFYFTNNEVGSAIDSLTFTKPYDSVPLVSKCLERANSRMFLANNLMGYDTPRTTSLSASVVQQNTGSTQVNGTYYMMDYILTGEPSNPAYPYDFIVFFLYFPTAVDATHPAGYYDLTATPLMLTSTPPTSPINISNYTFIGTDPNSDVQNYVWNNAPAVLGWSPTSINFSSQSPQAAIYSTGTPSTTNRTVLKSNSGRRIAIVFYDKYMRQCGVVPCPNGLITIPKRAYNFSTTYYYAIQWSLTNPPGANEIPDWAYYYSIVSTKDLTRSYFLQAQSGQIRYATKDASGNYVFTTTTYASTNAGIAVKMDVLNGLGFGYAFSEGDQLSIYPDTGSDVTVSVIGTSGDWVIGSLANMGDVTSLKSVYEIWTPASAAASQFYYEQGSVYPIQNPTSGNRAYSTTQGQIPGDTYLITRTNTSGYITENMSPNDRHYQKWFTNAGRLQLIVKIGQQRLKTAIRWSNVLVDGTRTNGLSSFDALNQKLLQHELIEINKIQLANKVDEQGQGNVMLSICPTEAASMYLGEVQLMATSETGSVATTDNVIGSVNILKGSRGTIHPESVVELNGNVWWFDALGGRFVQYSINGIDDISSGENNYFKFSRVAKQLAGKILSTDASIIEGYGARPFVFGGVDPYHKEVYWTFPKMGDAPKGYLQDYVYDTGTNPSYTDVDTYLINSVNKSAITYPYDILNWNKTKTIVFKIRNRWMGVFTWDAEGFTTLDSTLYTVKSGKLYKHNVSGSYNTFFGTQHRSKLATVCNDANEIKEFQSIAIEATKPEWVHARSEDPYEQSTDLVGGDFENKEGVYYASLFRDRLSPNISGSVEDKQFAGDVMRTKALLMLIQWGVGVNAGFRMISVGYNNSSGHY